MESSACSGKQTSQATTNNNDKNKNEIHAKKKDVLPISDVNDWRIILVNREHMLSKELGIELTSITQNAKPNMKIDSRIATSYQDMVATKRGNQSLFKIRLSSYKITTNLL